MALRAITWVFAGMVTACSAASTADLPPGGGGQGGDGGGSVQGGTGGAPVMASGGLAAGGSLIIGGGSSTGGASATTGGAPAAGGATGACSPPSDQPGEETCDGLDNDLDGFVDESGCTCSAGTTQPCFDGPPSQASAPNCHMGTQTCVVSREFGEWGPCESSGCDAVITVEACDNGLDDDCDGTVDEGCYLDAEVNLDGDCLSAFCPPQAPNPIGCQITMEGDDARGCVSHLAGSPEVYFQEGNACPACVLGFCTGGAGRVFGTLRCSSDLNAVAFDATNCVINKTEPSYPTPASTPITQPVSGCAL